MVAVFNFFITKAESDRSEHESLPHLQEPSHPLGMHLIGDLRIQGMYEVLCMLVPAAPPAQLAPPFIEG
jgi:hypothetical protein